MVLKCFPYPVPAQRCIPLHAFAFTLRIAIRSGENNSFKAPCTPMPSEFPFTAQFNAASLDDSATCLGLAPATNSAPAPLGATSAARLAEIYIANPPAVGPNIQAVIGRSRGYINTHATDPLLLRQETNTKAGGPTSWHSSNLCKTICTPTAMCSDTTNRRSSADSPRCPHYGPSRPPMLAHGDPLSPLPFQMFFLAPGSLK